LWKQVWCCEEPMWDADCGWSGDPSFYTSLHHPKGPLRIPTEEKPVRRNEQRMEESPQWKESVWRTIFSTFRTPHLQILYLKRDTPIPRLQCTGGHALVQQQSCYHPNHLRCCPATMLPLEMRDDYPLRRRTHAGDSEWAPHTLILGYLGLLCPRRR
jgi:hypothetical protein